MHTAKELHDKVANGMLGWRCDEQEEATILRALSYLDRRGLLIRKEGEPHMVRFVDAA